eukprot:CAMPEP_0204276968 /NCGR_PEP_ID=MMETSP0468-20130131/29032_1 /ASSEMBLY_ACC=CAM_ASM_000383 /TAXON_ID=2969 /ORGANISM="Oxyrrhis marina" /LENGTH=464 /DNA_ID=CAMNT_0051253677 /DNA_START=15 /DNA_END=1409 /DNA_ORIENTATION=+
MTSENVAACVLEPCFTARSPSLGPQIRRSRSGIVNGPDVISLATVTDDGEVKHLSGTIRSAVRELLGALSEDPVVRRDLRSVLDPSKSEFFFRVRPSYTCIRIDFLRVIIQPDRVAVMNPDDSAVAQYISEVRAEVVGKRCPIFDLWVLESVLCSVVTLFGMRMEVLDQVAKDLLRSVSEDSTEDSLVQLFPLKQSITQLKDKMHGILQGIKAIDVADSRGRSSHGLAASFAASSSAVDHPAKLSFMAALAHEGVSACEEVLAEFDEVLNSWEQNLEEVLRDCRELTHKIDDTSHFLEASMDSTRNRLILMDIVIQVLSTAFSLGAVVTAVLGMNLEVEASVRLFLKQDPAPSLGKIWGVNWFWGVVIFIVVVMGLMCLGAFVYSGRSQKNRRFDSLVQRYGSSKFFASIGQAGYVVGLFRAVDVLSPEVALVRKRGAQEARRDALLDAYATVDGDALPAVRPQ